MSQRKGYFAAADILRVFAVFMVGWYHIWQQSWLDPGFRLGSVYVNLQQVVRHGYVLVDVLLVISGFLLALPVLREDGEPFSARDFYRKRFWRIFPSYAAAVLLALFLWVLPQGEYGSARFLWKDLFAHLTFTHNLFFDTYFMTPLPIVLWTMGVEVQFYLLFPLAALFLREAPRLTCLTLLAAALAFRSWVYQLPDTTFYVNQLPGMLDLYACGMLAAYLYTRAPRPPRSFFVRFAAPVLCAVCFLLLIQIMYWQPTGDYERIRRAQLISRLPIGVACGTFLFCGAQLPAGFDRVFGNPVTRFLSAVSYNFYIWHQTLALRLKLGHIPPYAAENPSKAGEQPWQTLYTLLCFAAALAAAAFFTYFLEKPLSARAGRSRHNKEDGPNKAVPSGMS